MVLRSHDSLEGGLCMSQWGLLLHPLTLVIDTTTVSELLILSCGFQDFFRIGEIGEVFLQYS